jgi:ParB family chromosome partitioning protein
LENHVHTLEHEAISSDITAVVSAAAYAAARNGEEVQHVPGLEVASSAPTSWPNAVYGESGLTLALKYISEGDNPREYMDQAELKQLADSIALHGVFQAILVRFINGRYFVVAGHRRFRAAMMACGPEFPMLVQIRIMTDDEAHNAATIENTIREDMSAIEDARAAVRALGSVQGDRKEAARVLGWSPSMLESRLALMNCSESVQKALIERHILLGHAELFAALAKDKQDVLLPVIVSEKKSIAELKVAIEKAACNLKTAIFDKLECAACPHNSTLQSTMFAETVTDGSCTNRKCFNEKSENELAARAETLKDEYPIIRIVRVGDNSTLIKLVPDGPKGVGAEQANACRACSNFGAAVSGLPQAFGQTYRDLCFDTGCNAKKVAARIQAESATSSSIAAPAAGKPVGKGVVNGGAATKPPGAIGNDKPEASVTVHEGERIKEYRVKVWRKAMMTEIGNDPAVSAQYLLTLCLNGAARHINSSMLSNAFEKLSGGKAGTTEGMDSCARAVSKLDQATTESLTTLIAASAMEQLDVHKLQQLAKWHKLDLTKHWKLDEAFLELLTKSEIEVLGRELGLDSEFGEAYKKIFAEKKPDLIKKLLSIEGFNYSAKIPQVLRY